MCCHYKVTSFLLALYIVVFFFDVENIRMPSTPINVMRMSVGKSLLIAVFFFKFLKLLKPFYLR